MMNRLLTTAMLAVLLMIGACTPTDANDKILGYVEVEWVYVSAPQAGWLVSRPVDAGTEVAVGDVLFELDVDQQQLQVKEAGSRVVQAEAQARDIATGARPDEIRELRARLNEANAQLELARLEKKRVVSLVERRLEPEARLDEVVANYQATKARVDAAKQAIKVAQQAGRTSAQEAALAAIDVAAAARDSAQWTLEQRTVTSLLGGRVEKVFQHPGEYVSAGMPVLAVRTKDSLKVRFFVPQSKLSELQVGQSVNVIADGQVSAQAGTVSFIASETEFTPPVIFSAEARDKLVFMVEARIVDNPQIHPGLPVEISWP